LPRNTLNLGILAHVDAGKTTLTERLLYAAGVIDEIGSVDAGTTQTDTMALERQRGITIRSAVVSFPLAGVSVNLIDTPGHPDFIAEVERVLSVLDGAVLVISAVEGVQPQTRVLMRALQRLGVPTLLFVNKIDRGGADPDRVLGAIAARLTPAIVAMGEVSGPGTAKASVTPGTRRTQLVDVLTGLDETLLAAYVQDESGLTGERLRTELVRLTGQARVHPVFFGSAVTGAGVPSLMDGLVELLPRATGDVDGPASGRVFKIERGSAGQKVAYVRMFAGTVHLRDRVSLDGAAAKVTGINVFERGSWVRRGCVSAGEIGKLSGLGPVQIGAAIGQMSTVVGGFFAPPTLETAVEPVRPEQRHALRVALAQLAEQDPLINVRQDDGRREISVSLYGEVQKEVIQATLASDYGIEVTFRDTTVICIERPLGTGTAEELLNTPSNPFHAAIGLRIEPGPPGSGVEFRMDIHPSTVPLYVYKNADNFALAMGQYVRRSLDEGLLGWAVTDCVVTMTMSNYSIADGPPSRRGPLSTAADFRHLTPMVLMRALADAGTVVCEPILRVNVETPLGTVGAILTVLARFGAIPQAQTMGDLAIIEAMLPVAQLRDLQRWLPGLTGGEGVLESGFAGYQPIRGGPPVRSRTTVNPLNPEEYLMYLARQGVR
jgi:ribosomal protection tetracycline resistance protein